MAINFTDLVVQKVKQVAFSLGKKIDPFANAISSPFRTVGEAVAKPVAKSLEQGDIGAKYLAQQPQGTKGQVFGTFYNRQKQATGAGLSTVKRGVSEFGKSSWDYLRQTPYSSPEQNALNLAKIAPSVGRTLMGAGQTIASVNPLVVGARALSSTQVGQNMNVDIPFLGKTNVPDAITGMIEFTKDPAWKAIFPVTSKLLSASPTSSKVINFLAQRGMKGGAEGLIQGWSTLPENATNEQKVSHYLQNVGFGALSEVSMDAFAKSIQWTGDKTKLKNVIVNLSDRIVEDLTKLKDYATKPAYASMKTQLQMDLQGRKLRNVSGAVNPDELVNTAKELTQPKGVGGEIDLVKEALYSGDDEAARAIHAEYKGLPDFDTIKKQVSEEIDIARSKEIEAVKMELSANKTIDTDDPTNKLLTIADKLGKHFKAPGALYKITGSRRTYSIPEGLSLTVGGDKTAALDNLIYATDIVGFSKNIEVLARKFDGTFDEINGIIKAGGIDGADYDLFKNQFSDIIGTRPTYGAGRGLSPENVIGQKPTSTGPGISSKTSSTSQKVVPQPEGGVGVKGIVEAQKGQISAPQAEIATMPAPKPPISAPKPPEMGGVSPNGQAPSSGPIIDPVQKIITALKQAKPLEKQQGAIYSKIRSRQAGAIAGIGKNVPGEKGFYTQLGQLKGELPKVQFESIRKQITQPDIDSLFNSIEQSNISTFEKITAKSGLAKLLGAEGGSVPVQSELKLLNEVFPPEFIQSVLDQRSTMQKLFSAGAEALNLPRAMMATADLSAPLRQGVFLIGRPKQFLPALRDQFKYFFSEKAYKGLEDNIRSRPTYQAMRENKLAITNTGPLLQGREEAFMSNLAEKIPGFGSLAKASNRAYSGFLNKLRADVFDDLYKAAKTQGLDMDTVAPDLAKFVNTATGRGELGALERAAPVLNGVFFSPRLMASRLSLLNPKFYVDLNPFVRKEAIKSLLTFTGTGMTVLTLSKLAGAEVGDDPTSSDFGKIKVGNTRLDIWGGFQQYFRAAGQLITGKYTSSTTGKEYTLGEGYKPLTRLGIVGRVIESKEAPIVSFVSQLLTGQNSLGGKLDVPVEVLNRFIPMVASGFYDLYKEGGLKEVGLGLPSIFGVGVQTYGKQIPTQETTPAGKPKITLNPVPGLAEDIVGKIRGTQPSNIPQEKWAGIVQAKTDEQQVKILKDKIKQNPQSTDKSILNKNNIYVTDEGEFVDTNSVIKMPSSNPYEKALKEKEAYKLADDILKLPVPEQAAAFATIGISPDDAVYYNVASQENALKSLYVDQEIGKLDTGNRANLVNYLISQRKEVNGKMVLADGVVGELADKGIISATEEKMLKNLKITGGKVLTKLTGRGKKTALKKVSALPASTKFKAPNIKSMGSLLSKNVKLKVKKYKYRNKI